MFFHVFSVSISGHEKSMILASILASFWEPFGILFVSFPASIFAWIFRCPFSGLWAPFGDLESIFEIFGRKMVAKRVREVTGMRAGTKIILDGFFFDGFLMDFGPKGRFWMDFGWILDGFWMDFRWILDGF